MDTPIEDNLISLSTVHTGDGDLTGGVLADILKQYPRDAILNVSQNQAYNARPANWTVKITWYRKNDAIQDGEHFVTSKKGS